MPTEDLSSAMTIEPLHQEWLVLQQQCEQLEHRALQIKLLAAVLTAVGMFADKPLPGAALVLILWLQEAISRTQQTRLFDYLLQLESAIRSGQAMVPMQLNSRWLAARGGSKQLLQEYARHCLRPTVVFPYVPLLVLSALIWWQSVGLV